MYEPGQQPDPDFIKFFNSDWDRLLARVVIPGMEHDGISGPSWDRRAAYLVWSMMTVPNNMIDIEVLGPPPIVGFPFTFDAIRYEPDVQE